MLFLIRLRFLSHSVLSDLPMQNSKSVFCRETIEMFLKVLCHWRGSCGHNSWCCC
ncbi:hypothetical protein Hanom_Chr17g01533081 [Helianthus anomalus]